MKQISFQNNEIRPVLIKYLTEATESIELAIGWLDDDGIIALLQKKVSEGLAIYLILTERSTQERTKPNLTKLVEMGGRIIWLEEAFKEKLIDFKFGVIDSSVVLTGNYNWGMIPDPESCLMISEEMLTFVVGFETEFEYLSILNQLPTDEGKPENLILRLLKKMEVLKTLIRIDDTEFLHLNLDELEFYTEDENVKLIYDHLINADFDGAFSLIQTFCNYHHPLRECIDPPFERLQREIHTLEEEIANVSAEFGETQKKLHQFSKRHSENLGDLLSKILYQTKIKAEIEAKLNEDKEEDFEKAKDDYEEYTKSHKLAQKQKLKVLNASEQKELKKLYRRSSLKCHPDRVVDELHAEAEEIFVELNEAYKSNDLERVREISKQLKEGVMLSKSDGITELKRLESIVKTLSIKLEDWLKKLEDLKETPSYQTISNIENWDVYFEETKDLLEKQLERLQHFNKTGVEL